jgi:hypothetical protein
VTAAVESGSYDILLTWEASRATRDLTVYAALRDLCARAGVLWGYSGTVYDLNARADRFRTGMDALLSEDEAARISERVQRSVRARAADGRPHGKIPYGYRREYDPATGALLRQVPDEATAPVVREIYDRILAREGLHAIAVDFTRRGIAPPRPPRTPRAADGQAWIPSTVKRIATNPTMAGHRVHRGAIVAKADWPALVDQDTFDQVQAILTDPARSTRKGDSRVRHLLSGIALCGACTRGPMRVLNNRGRRAYTCLWCQGVTRVVEPVDNHVRDRVTALLALVDVHPDTGAVDEHTAQLQHDLTALRQRLDAFTDQAADGGLTPKALARIEARLLPQIRDLEQQVRASRAPDALASVDLDDPHGWWDAATLEQRRDLLRRAFRITILPAGRGRRTFNPDLIQVVPIW